MWQIYNDAKYSSLLLQEKNDKKKKKKTVAGKLKTDT